MLEDKEYTVSEDTSQSTQNSGGLNIVAGTNAEGSMGGSVVKEVASQATLEKEGKTTRDEVMKDIKNTLKSLDNNNVEKEINNLINKYFNENNFEFRQKIVAKNIINQVKLIASKLAKIDDDRVFNFFRRELKRTLRKLVNLIYGEGEEDKEGENENDENDENNKNGGEKIGERKKKRFEKKIEKTAKEAEKIVEKLDKDTKKLDKQQEKNQENSKRRIGYLTEFSGDFNKWDRKNLKKDFDESTRLQEYQNSIRNQINTENTLTKEAAYQKYDYKIKYGDFQLSDAITYATVIGLDITDFNEFKCFIGAVYGQIPDIATKDPKYKEKYDEYKEAYDVYFQKMNVVEDYIIEQVYKDSLTAKSETTSVVPKRRNLYESDFINFSISSANNPQNQIGLQVASKIDNVSDKLNHYSFKSNRTKHEEAALKYTAFNITFKNTFNLTNPIIGKLSTQQVDLRADLFKYGIYNRDSNTLNQSARDKYVSEKLTPLGLTPQEINELGNVMAGLPTQIEKNYEIISSNFDADQENFEKIAKIYTLGEIIDNIKILFNNEDIISENSESGTNSGFEFDESSADIVGDCLILKGKANGTETTIKYDLRTGKLYMNAFMQQEFNPPKITIGNNEPNTEIGNIGNFDDLLDGYTQASINRKRNMKHRKPYNNNRAPYSSNNRDFRKIDNDYINEKILKRLTRNKLLGKLSEIGKIVKEKAGEQNMENNVINEFLKTFNILPDGGNSGTIEFLGGSTLYILLESIKNTNDEGYLLKFSKLMNELMSFCGLSRGKNNLSPKEPDFDSVTIFNIDEKNATQDIISLQKANQSFFSDTGGEKDRIKGCESHFDASVKLSFANIIVHKCCRRYGEGWKISANHAQEFVDSIKKGIEDIKHDENDVVAMENMIEDESMWA